MTEMTGGVDRLPLQRSAVISTEKLNFRAVADQIEKTDKPFTVHSRVLNHIVIVCILNV